MAWPVLFVLVVLSAAVSSIRLDAQGTDAGLVGLVRGPNAVPMADVSVEAQHGATGYRARSVTNAAGRYVIPALPLGGPWTVTARRPGFQPTTRTGIVLTIGSRPTIDLDLVPVVTTLAEVAVHREGTEGRGGRVGGSTRITPAQVDALPVIDRNFASLAAIDPKVGAQLSLGGQRLVDDRHPHRRGAIAQHASGR